MSSPYIGEIRMFGGNFAPAGWSFCDGQLVAISENDTLFTLIGTTYGGDGQETFALPDLRGRVPLHQSTNFVMGQAAGVEEVTINIATMAAHTHPLQASSNAGTTNIPTATTLLATEGPAGISNVFTYLPPGGTPQIAMNPAAVGLSGGSQPHPNIQPSVGINYIISLFGIFPHT
jgi:microcystin-dependent protein